jgi:hypothetical protein
MDYQMTKDGKLVVTIDVSKSAWDHAKTSAKGNKVPTSGGFTKVVGYKLSINVIQAARGLFGPRRIRLLGLFFDQEQCQ